MTEANSLLQVPGPCNPCPLRLNLSSLNYLFMQNPWAHAGLCKYLCEHGKAYTSFISAITASEYKDLCLSLLAKFKHHMGLILFTKFLIDLRAFKSYIPNVLRPTPLPSLTQYSTQPRQGGCSNTKRRHWKWWFHCSHNQPFNPYQHKQPPTTRRERELECKGERKSNVLREGVSEIGTKPVEYICRKMLKP